MTHNNITITDDEILGATFAEFTVAHAKRIATMNENGNFEGDTASCGIMIDGTVSEGGFEIGQIIPISGVYYLIQSARNHNVKLSIVN